MKRNRLLIIVTVCFLSFALVLSACSGNNNNNASPSASPEDSAGASTEPTSGEEPVQSDITAAGHPLVFDSPITFSYFMNYDWATLENWGEQPDSKWMQENLQVTIEPIQSNGAAAEKLNSMIVSGELPGVMMTDRGKDVERLREAGQLVELDPYLEKYPAFREILGDEIINMLRSEDGKLYQIPNWYISGDKGNGNAGWIVEKKIYNELGSPKLETFEDLEAYLKLVKEKYPDVVPLDGGTATDSFYPPLALAYSGFGENKNGTFINPGSGQVFGYPDGSELKSAYQDPAFREAAVFMNKLYQQGLISQDAFTQTADQVKEKLYSGQIAVFADFQAVIQDYGSRANSTLQQNDPNDGYFPIWPVHAADVDKNKVYPSGFNSLGWNVLVITKNADDPESVFKFLTWLTSPEGQSVAMFGPPGMFWDEKDSNGYPIPNDAYINRDMKQYDELKIGSFNMAGNTSFVDTAKGVRESTLPEEARDWTTVAQSTVTFKTSNNVTEFSNLEPDPTSEEGIILQRLRDQFKQVVPKFFFAKSEQEVLSILDQAEQEAMGMGYDKVLKFKTQKWQENLNKMQNP